MKNPLDRNHSWEEAALGNYLRNSRVINKKLEGNIMYIYTHRNALFIQSYRGVIYLN